MLRDSHSNQIKGIKLFYKQQTKRINEKVENFESLKRKIKTVFNLEQDKNSLDIHLFSIPENGTKNEIKDNHTYLNYLNKNKTNCIKFLIESNLNNDYKNDLSLSQKIPEKEISTNVLSSQQEINVTIVKNFLNEIFDEVEKKSFRIIYTTQKQVTNIFNLNPIKEKLDHNFSSNFSKLENEFPYESIFNPNKNNTITSIFESCSLIIDRQIDSNIEFKQEKFIRDSQNNIKLSGSMMDFVDISEESQPPNAIFRDICSICSRNIYFVKYACCVCSNMVACEYCEQIHSHPMIKLKHKQFSAKEHALNLMISLQDKKSCDAVGKNFFKKIKEISEYIFDKKIKIKTSVYSYYMTVRPNRKFKIPFIITNESSEIIPKKKLIVLARNIKDLNIAMHSVDYELNVKESCEVFLECESTDQIKIYDFELFVYHFDAIIECRPVEMKIEINFDKEEDHLNDYFMMTPIIIALSKKEKEILYYIIKNGICVKDPIIIYNIVKKYDWNLDEAIDELNQNYDMQKKIDFDF